MSREILKHDFLTGQEVAASLGTPVIDPNDPGSWYKPQGIVRGNCFLGEIAQARETGWLLFDGLTDSGLRRIGLVPEGKSAGMSLEPVCPRTLQTQRNPEIVIGVWDSELSQFVTVDAEITEELVVRLDPETRATWIRSTQSRRR